MESQSHYALNLSRRSVLCGVGAAGLTAVAAGSMPAIAAGAQATPCGGPGGSALQMVYGFDAQFTGLAPIGLVPEGVRLDAAFSGTVVTGVFEGGTVEGNAYELIRQDGVGKLEVRGLLRGPAGEVVSVRVHGYIIPPAGMEFPPLDVLLSPDFTWPDVDQTVHGFALFETGVPELAWMNSTALAVDGTSNAGTGVLSVTAYAFSPIPGLGGS